LPDKPIQWVVIVAGAMRCSSNSMVGEHRRGGGLVEEGGGRGKKTATDMGEETRGL
jgi:hypothetical protein